MKLRTLFKTKETGDDQWIATADIMATLMLIFAFIALIFTHQTIEKISKEVEVVQKSIYQALIKEFNVNELSRWGAVIDEKTGTVTFSGVVIQFDTDSDIIKPAFKVILDDFFPRYVNTLRPFRGSIEEIDVEGHSNSKIPKNYTMRDGYDHNMNLSQRRAYSVMKYSLDTLDNDVLLNIRNKYNVNWMQEIIRAVGYSSSKPVRTSFGEEDLLRSKRVQFRIRIDNNDFMEQIRKLQDPSMRGASGTL
tara:strand:+ start:4294 stop:5040 length:747 start_codon:yes stop_codon:yes gene_type:complete